MVDIAEILQSQEVLTMLETFSKNLNISVWIAGPEVDIINKVSKVWGEKEAKKEMKRCGMLKAICIPGRIEMRKKALSEKRPVDVICDLGLHIFTVPIYYEGELIGFFEGDGGKAEELTSEYGQKVDKMASKWKFDPNVVKRCIGYENIRCKTMEEMYGMMSMVSSTIELYLKLIGERNLFVNKLNKINSNVQSTARNLQMLGINAAIEAARIGSNGNGVSVVAGQIKELGDFVFKQVGLIKDILQDFVGTNSK
ncbi:MAG: hypothetical protein DRP50_00975 [Thermotoga sp.]|nr:MAG: hypothetical protein DRP50_00975 [Thermotoga sp.]